MASRKSETHTLVTAAVVSALGVVILTLGSFIEVLDLSVAVIASLLVAFAVIELGGKYPYLVYVVTALLSMLLLPVKTAPLAYLLFMGYYPILKAKLEKCRMPSLLCWVLKILIFNAVLAIVVLVAVLVLHVPVPAVWYYWMLPLLTPVFLLYDVVLSRLVTFYLLRLRDRFRFLKK